MPKTTPKNYSKAESRISMLALLTLFISVGIQIAAAFSDRPASTWLIITGIVGLLLFLFLTYKAGKAMEKADAQRSMTFDVKLKDPRPESNPVNVPQYGQRTTRSTSVEDVGQYK